VLQLGLIRRDYGHLHLTPDCFVRFSWHIGCHSRLRTVCRKCQNHITTNDQSVSVWWFRAHSGTCDQIFLHVQRLMTEGCCLVFVEHPLWREVGCVLCQSQPVVICQEVHLIFTLHEFHTVKWCPSFVQQILSYLTLPQQFRHLNSHKNDRRQV
jgi:hypothetical protein